jgi:hypothetical protein
MRDNENGISVITISFHSDDRKRVELYLSRKDCIYERTFSENEYTVTLFVLRTDCPGDSFGMSSLTLLLSENAIEERCELTIISPFPDSPKMESKFFEPPQHNLKRGIQKILDWEILPPQKCPHCDNSCLYEIEALIEGVSVKCQNCGKVIDVPEEERPL